MNPKTYFILIELRYKLFVCISEPHKYQLWVYIYQARDLIAKDESGMNGKCPEDVSIREDKQFTNLFNQTLESMQNCTQQCCKI